MDYEARHWASRTTAPFQRRISGERVFFGVAGIERALLAEFFDNFRFFPEIGPFTSAVPREIIRSMRDPFMNIISQSVIDDLVGGSQFAAGSPEYKKWNIAYECLYRRSCEVLLGFLSRNYPTLTWQDHQDILQATLIAFRANGGFRRAVMEGTADRVEHANRLIFTLCKWRAQSWKARRMQIQHREGMSLDAPLRNGSIETLADAVASCEDLLKELHDGEELGEKKTIVGRILTALRENGARSAETVAIFEALLHGCSPAELMEQFGVSRGKVDTTKYELVKQIRRITQFCVGGLPLKEAIAAASTRSKTQ